MSVKDGGAANVFIGDWVRFYRNGALVIGVVAYLRTQTSYPWHDEAFTDQGVISVKDIIEVRSSAMLAQREKE